MLKRRARQLALAWAALAHVRASWHVVLVDEALDPYANRSAGVQWLVPVDATFYGTAVPSQNMSPCFYWQQPAATCSPAECQRRCEVRSLCHAFIFTPDSGSDRNCFFRQADYDLDAMRDPLQAAEEEPPSTRVQFWFHRAGPLALPMPPSAPPASPTSAMCMHGVNMLCHDGEDDSGRSTYNYDSGVERRDAFNGICEDGAPRAPGTGATADSAAPFFTWGSDCRDCGGRCIGLRAEHRTTCSCYGAQNGSMVVATDEPPLVPPPSPMPPPSPAPRAPPPETPPPPEFPPPPPPRPMPPPPPPSPYGTELRMLGLVVGCSLAVPSAFILAAYCVWAICRGARIPWAPP